MILIPYKRLRFKTSFEKEEIEEILKRIISKPSWKMNMNTIINNQVIEGKVSNESFIISLGRFSSTYGKTTFLPIMKGEVICDHQSPGSIINVVIRSFRTGMLILVFFYLLCGVILYLSILKQLFGGIVVGCIFYFITYVILLFQFNIAYKKYVGLIQLHLFANIIK